MITNINNFSAMPIHPQVYEAGSPATPAVHLFFGNAELEEGVHFTVEYTGNDGIPTPGNPIKATATITDKEDPSSTRTLDFIICTADDYDRVYMNWIADILKETAHVPGNEGTEIGGTGMLLDMVSPLDEYIVHAVLAEELQLEYDLCTAAERSFFTQDRVNAMRRHYSGATRNTTLTNNGVTLISNVRSHMASLFGYAAHIISNPKPVPSRKSRKKNFAAPSSACTTNSSTKAVLSWSGSCQTSRPHAAVGCSGAWTSWS